MTKRFQVSWAVITTLLLMCAAFVGCGGTLAQPDGATSGGGASAGPLTIPDSFFPDIPLPDGAKVTAIRVDEFGDPVVVFAIPSPAQPLNAWYTIESAKKKWAQLGSTERIDGGGTGSFAHTTENRAYNLVILAPDGDNATVTITYRVD